jgi:hypothetical protein
MDRVLLDLGHSRFSVDPSRATDIDIPHHGEFRTCELRVVEADWDGEPSLLAVVRDVTQQRRLESKLLRRHACGRSGVARMAWSQVRHRARLIKDYAEVQAVWASESRRG